MTAQSRETREAWRKLPEILLAEADIADRPGSWSRLVAAATTARGLLLALDAAEERAKSDARLWLRVERVLDRVLGTEPEDGAGEGLAGDVALAIELAWDRALEHAWQLNDPAYTVIAGTSSIHPILTRTDIEQAKTENPYRGRS